MLDINIVLAKVESSYGTDAAPAAATDALIVFDWTPQPVQYDTVQRRIDRGFAGARPTLNTRPRQQHGFSVELCGSGTAATPAKWGSVLLRGCLFGAPNIAADVTYPLASGGDDGASLSFYGQKGGTGDLMRMRAQGQRQNAVFNFEEGNFPYIVFDGIGLLNDLPDATAISAPTLPVYPDPVEVNSANTTFTLDTYALKLRSFTLDLGLRPTYRSLVNHREIIFDSDDGADRRGINGQIVCELPGLAAKNYFSAIHGSTPIAMSLVHGTAAGNIVSMASSKLVLGAPTFSTEQRRYMMSVPYRLVPDAAGNELTLKTA